MTYSDGEAGAFIAGVLLLNFILAWVACYIGSIKERWEQEDRELFFRSCQTLSDEQKHKADSVDPVRSESEHGKYLCKGRIELLEKAPASGSDTPQSIDGSGSIFFSGEIEVTRKNEKS